MKLLQTGFIQCYSNLGIKKYHSTFAVDWELNKRKHSFTDTNKKAIIVILLKSDLAPRLGEIKQNELY